MSDEPQIIVNWLFNGKFDGAKNPSKHKQKKLRKQEKKSVYEEDKDDNEISGKRENKLNKIVMFSITVSDNEGRK